MQKKKFGRDVPIRRKINQLLIKGGKTTQQQKNVFMMLRGGAGECTEEDYDTLELYVKQFERKMIDNNGSDSSIKYTSEVLDKTTITNMTRLPSTSCMVSFTIENSDIHFSSGLPFKQKMYAKMLTERQFTYYKDNWDHIHKIHVPCYIYGLTMSMREFGVPATTLPRQLQEEAEAWAIDQVRQLHAIGLYHGDIFKNATKLNLGNILVKVQDDAIQEIKLIDFGPPHESQSDADLLNVEKDFLRRYDLIKADKSDNKENVTYEDLAPPPTPMKNKRGGHKFKTKKKRRRTLQLPEGFDLDEIL